MRGHPDNAVLGLRTRLASAIEFRGYTIRRLADETRIPYRSLQSYLLGERSMSADAVRRVAETLCVSADWLLTGRPAVFDPTAIAICLSLIEDVRGLSGSKASFEECAALFERFYWRETVRLFPPDPSARIAAELRPAKRRARSRKRTGAD